mmetsp:Transcript_48837/g.110828  ORF Transcript_48837/g.110828 Transcript_48837/m.110828 type:complete len:384 (-) Transcript_48837:452-1603(-)
MASQLIRTTRSKPISSAEGKRAQTLVLYLDHDARGHLEVGVGLHAAIDLPLVGAEPVLFLNGPKNSVQVPNPRGHGLAVGLAHAAHPFGLVRGGLLPFGVNVHARLSPLGAKDPVVRAEVEMGLPRRRVHRDVAVKQDVRPKDAVLGRGPARLPEGEVRPDQRRGGVPRPERADDPLHEPDVLPEGLPPRRRVLPPKGTPVSARVQPHLAPPHRHVPVRGFQVAGRVGRLKPAVALLVMDVEGPPEHGPRPPHGPGVRDWGRPRPGHLAEVRAEELGRVQGVGRAPRQDDVVAVQDHLHSKQAERGLHQLDATRVHPVVRVEPCDDVRAARLGGNVVVLGVGLFGGRGEHTELRGREFLARRGPKKQGELLSEGGSFTRRRLG